MQITPPFPGNRIISGRGAGFTLMELMLVLGIISILIVAGVRIGPAIRTQAQNSSASADIGTLSGFIMSWQSTHGGKPPKSINDLVTKGIITEQMSTDPWGNTYLLETPARRSKDKYDLYSKGKNPDDPSDDIGNWSE